MKTIYEIIRDYFKANDDLQFRLYCIMIGLGILASLATFLLCLFAKFTHYEVYLTGYCLIFILIIGSIGFKEQCYEKIAIIISIVLNYMIFPLLYLVSSGTYGGMPLIFVLGLFFSIPLVKQKKRYILFTSELVFYVLFMVLSNQYVLLTNDFVTNSFVHTIIISITFFIVMIYIFSTTVIIMGQYKKEKLKVEELNYELMQQALKDPLTQVYNRTSLMSYMTTRKNIETTHLGLCMLDLDDFKCINDTYGHLVGDRALIKLCEIATQFIKEDGFVVRYGGEEFVILFYHYDRLYIETILQKIRDELWGYFKEKDMQVTFSCGVTDYRYKEDELERLNRADELLYQAKHNGKNQSIIDYLR